MLGPQVHTDTRTQWYTILTIKAFVQGCEWVQIKAIGSSRKNKYIFELATVATTVTQLEMNLCQHLAENEVATATVTYIWRFVDWDIYENDEWQNINAKCLSNKITNNRKKKNSKQTNNWLTDWGYSHHWNQHQLWHFVPVFRSIKTICNNEKKKNILTQFELNKVE